MILIDNQPIPFPNPSSLSQGWDILDILLANPILELASTHFKSEPERIISEGITSDSGGCMKQVYVFQREFATVDPTAVQIVGTDELTTSVGLVIRNRNNGLTSVSHMDFPEVVDQGLNQMVQSINDPETILDVFLVGSFDDSPNKNRRGRKTSKEGGYSRPLCHKIIMALINRPENFNLRLLFVLRHNTRNDSNGHQRPIFGGLLVATTTGQVLPTCFENLARSPDEIVRRLLAHASYDDMNLRGKKLLDIYDTRHDKITIPCVQWSLFHEHALATAQLSDEEFLLQFSTSPSAEPSHFVQCQRRSMRYIIEHPDWRYTFPEGKSRVFQRNDDGTWSKCD